MERLPIPIEEERETFSAEGDFTEDIFPDLKKANMNFPPQSTFSVPVGNSMGHNGSKAASKFEKRPLSGMPHPPYSPEMSPCDFWLFGLLKGILKDREFNSIEEIEAAIAKTWKGLSLDDLQNVFLSWMKHRRWAIANG
jgi:hypothetical protein